MTAEGAKHDPFAALRQPSFVLYSLNRGLAAIAQSILQLTMAWQVLEISGSVSNAALNLGFLALARFLAALATSLAGGVVADAFDRRLVMVSSKVVPLACALVLGVGTLGGWVQLELIFVLVILTGFASSFEGPARQALLPAIVRPETFANAVTVANMVQRLGGITGPIVAGGVIAATGIAASYFIFVITLVVSAVPLLMLRYEQPQGGRSGANVKAALEGLKFVRRQQAVLGAMSLDMFATIFGGAAALLPIYASDILDVGPTGLGVLTASMSAGAYASSLMMMFRPAVRRTGRVLVYCVVAYGLLTVAFGLSREFVLSVVLYGLIGSVDMVSIVMRQQIIQMATPNELRGRVSAVYQVFLGASNQGGAMESGFVAAATSATFAVVSGGFAAAAIAGFIGWRMPKLFHYESGSGAPPDSAAPAVPASTAEKATASVSTS
jgi:MFS family permease